MTDKRFIIKTQKTHIVPKGIDEIRLQNYAKEIFGAFIPSNKGIKKAIKRELITVNGKPSTTGYIICPGDEITLFRDELKPPKNYQLKLEIIHEDEHLTVILKPAGIPTSGNQFKTIQNALLFNLKETAGADALSWPKPVHRLDASTSGLLLIAKTKLAQMSLGQQFEEKTIQKQYHALVIGKPEQAGEWKSDIEGKFAHTSYVTLQTVPSLRNESLSLVELHPHTGRTHQLRIHLSEAGFPIMGDKLYGTEGEIFKGKGLFLSSTGVKFIHPFTREQLSFEVDIPPKFNSLLKREQRRWEKYKGEKNV